MQLMRRDRRTGIICSWEQFQDILSQIAEGVVENPAHSLMSAEEQLRSLNYNSIGSIGRMEFAVRNMKKTLTEIGRGRLELEDLTGRLTGLSISVLSPTPKQQESYFFEFMAYNSSTGQRSDISSSIAESFKLEQGLGIEFRLKLDVDNNKFSLDCDQLLQLVESAVFPAGLTGHGLACFIVGRVQMSKGTETLIKSGPGYFLKLDFSGVDDISKWNANANILSGPIPPNNSDPLVELVFRFDTESGHFSNLPLNSEASIKEALIVADKLEAGLQLMCGPSKPETE